MKDYYEILNVGRNADNDEIRRQYRKLAMEYHPDRNPENPDAEARFKEIAEAYGVLTDPVKRKEYNIHLDRGGTQESYQSGFSYSQEDILKDLFRDPRFQQMFQGILREFQRSGLRASPHFLRKSFFGGKGGFLIGGLFLFGSLAGPAILKGRTKIESKRGSVLKKLGSSVGRLLNMQRKEEKESTGELDITYQTPLSEEELKQGKVAEVITYGKNGREVLKVKIPPGSRYGQKLRLRGKGRQGNTRRGDLLLQLVEKK
ncbi:MAG: DnaJ domain-containing protein [Desulfocapsaceae bacterium]|nr:DnaJ domain-containing protein [Desulfocapsaceae bacterium]